MSTEKIDAITKRIYDKADAELKKDILQRGMAYHRQWYVNTEQLARFKQTIESTGNLHLAFDGLMFEIERDKNREDAIRRFMEAVDAVSSQIEGG